MARITVEDCLEHIDNSYDLVLIASHRARMLQSGVDARVVDEGDKSTVRALREIAEGVVDGSILDDPIPEMVTKEERKSFSQLIFNKEEGDGVILPSSADNPFWGEKMGAGAETQNDEGATTISIEELKEQELAKNSNDDTEPESI